MDFNDFQVISRVFKGLHGISRDCMGFQWISGNSHISRNFEGFHGITVCTSLQNMKMLHNFAKPCTTLHNLAQLCTSLEIIISMHA